MKNYQTSLPILSTNCGVNPHQNQSIDQYLGKTSDFITNFCAEQGLKSVRFAHWFAIPQLKILLIFHHQKCVSVVAHQI